MRRLGTGSIEKDAQDLFVLQSHAPSSGGSGTPVSIIAGNGLTGGGLLDQDRTLNVGAGTGISVGADDVSVNTGYAFSWGARHTFGAGLTVSAGQTVDFGGDVTLSRPAADVLGLGSGDAFESGYTSGWAGSGFHLDYDQSYSGESFAEIDRLSVRGIFNVYELQVHQIRATNGSIFVSNTGKAKSVTDNGGGSYTIETETDHGFAANDLIRAQRFTGTGTYQSDMTVTSVADTTHFTATLRSTYTAPAAGMEYVRLGNTSDTDRQGSIYLTADDTNAPYINILADVASFTDWGTSAKTKVRIGNMNGAFGVSADGYGVGLGDYSGGNYLLYEPTGGLQFHAGDGSHILDDTGWSIYHAGGVVLYRYYDDQPVQVSDDYLVVNRPTLIQRVIRLQGGSSYNAGDIHFEVSSNAGGTSTLSLQTSGFYTDAPLVWIQTSPLYIGSLSLPAGSDGDIVMSGDLQRSTTGTQNIGTSGAYWDNIYVTAIHASTIEGSTIGGQTWTYDGSSMNIQPNYAGGTSTVYIANPDAGQVANLDVEGSIVVGGSVDGVDVSDHAANANAHHTRQHAITSTADHTASGLTAGQVLRATGSTTWAWQAIQDGDLPSTIVRTSRTLTAGNGLTGGGDLSADRTFTLGTPSSVSVASLNGVSTGSHSHAVTYSSNPGATASLLATNSSGYLQLVRLGLGMSPSYALDVTGVIRNSSTAMLSWGNYSTTSPTVQIGDAQYGAAAGSSILYLFGVNGVDVNAGSTTLAAIRSTTTYFYSGLDVSDATTLHDDFTIGSNLLFFNYSQGNLGIDAPNGGNPDQQFLLDVGGPIRGTYLVGKHAIQLSDAVIVCHFDGPQPFKSNYGGTTTGHLGQIGTTTGGALFRPGKFEKGIQIAEATTNLILNPSAETGTSYIAAVGTGTTMSQTDQVMLDEGYGDYCVQITTPGTVANEGVGYISGSSLGYTGSARTFIGSIAISGASGSVQVWTRITYVDASNDNSSATTLTLDGGDHRVVTGSVTSNAAKTVNYIQIFIRTPTIQAITFYTDAAQVEEKTYATSYCDGSLGDGYSWSATAHASSSSRTGATLTYEAGTVNESIYTEGTIMAWHYYTGTQQANDYPQLVEMGYDADNEIRLMANQNSTTGDRPYGVIRYGGTTLSTAVVASLGAGWHHLVLTWSLGGYLKIYVDGVLEDDTASYSTLPTGAPTLRVGNNVSGGGQTGSVIDDVVILDREMDADEIRAVYESDAPVFAETSTFVFRSPTRIPVWVDDEGLWMRDISGNSVVGFYGGSPDDLDGTGTKTWGGATLGIGDVLFGDLSNGGGLLWDASAHAISLMDGTTERIGLTAAGVLTIKDSGGSAVFTFDSSLGAEFTKPLTLGTGGGIYQGSGSFASPTTGLKLWNDSGVGRLAGYNGGTLQAGFDTDGRLWAGGTNIWLDAEGLQFKFQTSSSLDKAGVNWRTTTGSATPYGQILTYGGTSGDTVMSLNVRADSGYDSRIELSLHPYSGPTALLYLISDGTLYWNGFAKVDGDVYSDAFYSYFSTSSKTGWSAYDESGLFIKRVGNLVFVWFRIVGDSNSTSTSFTVPFTSNSTSYAYSNVQITFEDGGTWSTTPGRVYLAPGSTTVNCFTSSYSGSWSSTGKKAIVGQLFYEMA